MVMDGRLKSVTSVIAVYSYFVLMIVLAIFEIGPLIIFAILSVLGISLYFFYLITVASQQSIETDTISALAKSWPRKIFRSVLLTLSVVFGFFLFIMMAIGQDANGFELITNLLGTTALAEQMAEFNRRIRVLIGILAMYLSMKFVHNFDQGVWSALDSCVQYLADEEIDEGERP